MALATRTCPVCGNETVAAGSKHSDFSNRTFHLADCPTCRFSFVTDPRTDFADIYDARYYAGKGADPHVSYVDGVERDGSVQGYEWQGIIRVLRDLHVEPGARWLDFGCGLGGLLRYGRSLGYDVSGFDEGFAAAEVEKAGLPILTPEQLQEQRGTFDVVTAIEVVEHVVDPSEVFATLGAMLRPGGLLFLTTGNARPYREKLSSWQYVRPDIHISFYEPETLERCMRDAGLVPARPTYGPGYRDIIRSKVLRTIGVNRRNLVERCLPWSVLSRLVDRRFGVSHQPIATRPVDPPDHAGGGAADLASRIARAACSSLLTRTSGCRSVGGEPALVGFQLVAVSTRIVRTPAARPASMSTHRSPTIQLAGRSTSQARAASRSIPGSASGRHSLRFRRAGTQRPRPAPAAGRPRR